MRVTSVLGAQAVRFVSAPDDIPEDKRVPFYPLIRGLQERYSFLQVPTRIEDFDFNKGVTFLRGRFEHKTIEKFQIYQRGILCESKVDTDYCERFIEEILEFGREMGVNLLKVEGPDRTYFSSLEIQVNGSVDKNVAHLSWLSALLARKFKNYGISTGDYSTMGFKMSYDELGATTPKSTEFVFERRAGSPYSASLYASWGSLKTADHIEVLEALEKMMTD